VSLGNGKARFSKGGFFVSKAVLETSVLRLN
jgi:hypothetical protein